MEAERRKFGSQMGYTGPTGQVAFYNSVLPYVHSDDDNAVILLHRGKGQEGLILGRRFLFPATMSLRPSPVSCFIGRFIMHFYAFTPQNV